MEAEAPQPVAGTVQPVERKKGAWDELFSRSRVYLWVAVFGVELAIFFAAILYPLDPASQQAALQEAKSTLGNESTLGPGGLFSLIFTNNSRIALLEMAPGFGGLLFVFSIVTTGEVIQALAVSGGAPGVLYGVLLFIFPFTILELGAYALAFSSGIMVFVGLAKRRLWVEARVFLIEVLLVIGVLALAAAMETLTIVSWTTGFALWVPVGIGAVAIVVKLRRRWAEEQGT